jgi:hypothetical protein
MKVAWHAVPEEHAFAVPSRRERYDLRVRGRGFFLDTALSHRQSGTTGRP